jgi:steroid delta-isomerase-like uncharacterized protein
MPGEKNKALEENKTIVRRWFDEVWNQRRAEAIDELAADNFILYHFAMPSPIDKQTYTQVHPIFMAAFPDFHIAVDDLIAEDDRVSARITQQATHQGEFLGIPATGKQVTLRGIAIYRIEKGKIVEAWAAETAWAQILTENAAS